MKIGLLGDVHGMTAWVKVAVDAFERQGIDTIIQVGDLGVTGVRREAERWHRINKYMRLRGVTRLVAPGNHEDHDYIDALEPNDDGWLRWCSNILLAPRGLRTEMGGRSFVWLGGCRERRPH